MLFCAICREPINVRVIKERLLLIRGLRKKYPKNWTDNSLTHNVSVRKFRNIINGYDIGRLCASCLTQRAKEWTDK